MYCKYIDVGYPPASRNYETQTSDHLQAATEILCASQWQVKIGGEDMA